MIIYYKLWKKRHITHGQRLDCAQIIHKSSTSVQYHSERLQSSATRHKRPTPIHNRHSKELDVRLVCGCVSNRYMYRFDLAYPYAVSVSASAHMESLLCVYTITIFCRIRMPHPYLWNRSFSRQNCLYLLRRVYSFFKNKF